MGMRPWIRAVTAVLLLVTMAGVGVPCADAISAGELTLSAGGASAPTGGKPADCHCVCHASWIPVQPAGCCGVASLSRIEAPAPATPEGSCLPLFGEPPRSA